MRADAKKSKIVGAVAVHQETFCRMSDAIWSYAELPLEEHKSAELVARTLEANGFEVTRGVAGLPTAIVASWSNGTGKPVVGLMGEYDALPMLSQKAGIPRQDPLVPGAPGHGCSHNTMCAVQGLAAVSLKEIMQKYNIDGTIKLFGCPAEEILISRPYMIRAGLFDHVDAVIDCHGEDSLKIPAGTEGTACISFMVTFRGKTAHSGSSPWKGRSAADAVELMHAGTERMREHLPITQRSHWVTLEGGEAPNVVPDRASTWYYVRDVDENIRENFQWMQDCAKGAALMTQTNYELKVLGAVHQRFHNTALAELIFENMKQVKLPKYSAEEEAYALEIQKTLGFPRKGMTFKPEIIRTQMAPPQKGGSSDVGDVTLIAPTATVKYPVRVPGSYSHHWSVTSAALGSIARKGIVTGAAVVAFSAFDLLTNPAVLGKIRSEFEALSKERPYRTFLPDDAEPPFGIYSAIQEKYRSALEKFYII